MEKISVTLSTEYKTWILIVYEASTILTNFAISKIDNVYSPFEIYSEINSKEFVSYSFISFSHH